MSTSQNIPEQPFPMRLQKFLARAGVASRRGSEDLMTAGRVSVNGVTVTELGSKVDPKVDVVCVDGREVHLADGAVYIMLNKPRGYVTTLSDEQGRKCVADLVESTGARIYPVGRLDFTTEGLLLLTNDGELANTLTHPRHEVGKRYLTIIDDVLTADDVKKLEKGVFIEGGKTAPARVKILKSEPGRTELTIIIHEGRNHQVKKMFEAIEKNVIFLKRISVGDINLGTLKKGEYRHLTEEEVTYLKSLK